MPRRTQQEDRSATRSRVSGENEIESSIINVRRNHMADEQITHDGTPEPLVVSADQDGQEAPRAQMTPQETTWWAMSFEELYKHAKEEGFGKKGSESRKSGRIRIIRWLCENAGIVPYVAPSTIATDNASLEAGPVVRSTGAISHPEAILRTSDPDLQMKIDAVEKEYNKWAAADLLKLSMQRSYQLLKDSHGKLPSKSISAMANWNASWEVLKSAREKEWWLGDGIDLVNKAKAMGYQGSSKKYDVIVWLRTTREAADNEVKVVAEPTPNRKRKPGIPVPRVSKRPAKGSKRPNGWDTKPIL